MAMNDDYKGTCLTCNGKIVGKVTSFTQNELKYSFHSTCFVCDRCSKSMEGKAFYNHEGKYFDKECYHSVVLGSCSACKVVFEDPQVVKAGGKQFHPRCFKCSTCCNELTSSYIEKEDCYYCRACYDMANLPPCGSCGKPITPEVGTNKLMAIEYKGQKFHVACFNCKNCNRPFSDLKALLHGSELFCKPCYEEIAL